MLYSNPGPAPQQATVARKSSTLSGRNLEHDQAHFGDPLDDCWLGREGGDEGRTAREKNRHASCKYIIYIELSILHLGGVIGWQVSGAYSAGDTCRCTQREAKEGGEKHKKLQKKMC